MLPELRPDLQRPDPVARPPGPAGRPSRSPPGRPLRIRSADPFDDTTRIGPLVSAAQRERVRSYIRKGIDEGARLVAGGPDAPDGLEKGFFVRPTVFSEVRRDMTIAQEEIFGPVLSIIPYDSEDEAVEIANDSIYGLAGAVWAADAGTRRQSRATHSRRSDRYQRRQLQPAGALRRLQAVGSRTRAGQVRARGVPRDEVAADVAPWVSLVVARRLSSRIAPVRARLRPRAPADPLGSRPGPCRL